MAVTRINNNQISDAAGGNTAAGIDASTKVQDYSITGGKLANNLTYGNNLTVSGNLTVQGNTTQIDTDIITVEDPLILLASNQTGSPTLDIGFIGQRGTSENIAFVWEESADAFVTAFTSTGESNTTITVTSYANLITGNANVTANLAVVGTTSLVGNIISDANVTGNISTAGLTTIGNISATGLVTGGNISATGNITANAVNAVSLSLSGNILSNASVQPGSFFIGDGAYISNISGANVSATKISNGNSQANIGTPGGNLDVTINNATTAQFYDVGLSVFGNVTLNAAVNAANLSLTGNVLSSLNVDGNIFTPGTISATGTATVGNVDTIGTISATANITGGNVLTGGIVSATSNISGGNVLTGGIVSATANITGGNISTAGLLTGGNISTGGEVSATANITGGNITTAGLLTGGNISTAGNVTANAVNAVSLSLSGNILSNASVQPGSYFIGDGYLISNISGANVSSTKITNGNSQANIGTSGGNLDVTIGGNSTAQFYDVGLSVFGNVTLNAAVNAANLSLTGNVLSALNVDGNIIGANISTGGEISATGTATVGNVSTIGTISATANITGGNVLTGGVVSATANIIGGNVTTIGDVSASGNIYGNTVITDLVTTTTVLVLETTAGNSGISIDPNGTGNINVNTSIINNVATPLQPADAANKEYVDSIASGLDLKASVEVATLVPLDTEAEVTLVAYNNGAAGVGATLTITTTSQLLIDGVDLSTLAINDRVLIKDELDPAAGNSDAAWNGIYTLTSTGALQTVLTRSVDFDNEGTLGSIPGSFTFVIGGGGQAGTGWVCYSTNPIVMGTTPILWSQFSGGGTYTGGNAIAINGTVISALFDGNTVGVNGSNQLYIPANVPLTTPNIGAATGTSLSVTGNVDAGNVRTVIVSASGNVTGNAINGVNLSLSGNVIGNLSVDTNVIANNVLATTSFSTAGNVIAGNVNAANLSLTGNVISNLNVTADITANNVYAVNTFSAGGNVTAANFTTTGAAGNITGANVIAGTTLSATGNLISGNVNTGNISLSGNVISTLNVDGNIQTANFFIGDGGYISNINAANVAVTKIVNGGSYANAIAADGNVVIAVGAASNVAATFYDTGVNFGGDISTAGNVTGTLLTGTLSTAAQPNVTSVGTLTSLNSGDISSSGNVTAANISTAGLLSGGNISTAGNVTADAVNAANLSLSGNILSNASVQPGSFFIGDGAYISNISGANVSATKISNGNSQANIGTAGGNLDITINNATTAQFYDTGLSVFGNIVSNTGLFANSLSLSGNVESTLNVTGDVNANNVTAITQVTAPTVTSSSGLLNIGTAGNTSVAINGASANLVFVDGTANSVSIGSNVQTTNAILALNATSSFVVPVGNTAQRPSTGVTGMQRFNTSTGFLEIYDGVAWAVVGGEPTVITDQQFNGNGVQTVFTLSSPQTTNSCLVSINGVVQVPTLAYSVVGTDLTFTEAPAVADHIDVREITTTTTVTGISNTSGNAAVGVNDASANVAITGNIVVGNGAGYLYGDGTYLTNVGGGNVIATKIQEGNTSVDIDGANGNVVTAVNGANVLVTSPLQTTITGNFNPSANATYTLGNSTNQWSNLWISGNTIFIGGSNISANTTTLSFGGQPLVTQNANGNITGGNVTATTVSASGNITGSYIIGNGSQLTGLPAGYANSDVATYLSSGTVSANILTTGLISATGTITSAATLQGGNVTTTGLISATGNINAGNIRAASRVEADGVLAGASLFAGGISLTGNTISSLNSTIIIDPNSAGGVDGAVIIAGNLSVQGNVTYIDSNVVTTNEKSITLANNVSTGTAADGAGIDVGNNSLAYLRFNNATTSWQANIGITPAANATLNLGGTSNYWATVYATGATVSGNVSVTGNTQSGNILTGGLVSVTGNITGGNLSVGNGTITVGNIVTLGNVAGNIGSSTNYFNTVFAKATSAQYADLAEKYTADAEYTPGTVVAFGGELEVTASTADADRRVAGVVSTNPSYIMNGGLEGTNIVTVALTGRVPTRVTGTVRKGDLMVSNGDGTARAEANPQVGTVIGKALENFDGTTGVIEVVVGRV